MNRSIDLKSDIGKIIIPSHNTALIQYCINYGHLDISKCKLINDLIKKEHGCYDKDGHSALFYAARRGNLPLVIMLCEYKDEFKIHKS